MGDIKFTHQILRSFQRSDLEAELNRIEAECGESRWISDINFCPVVIGQDVVYIAHVVIAEEVEDAGW